MIKYSNAADHLQNQNHFNNDSLFSDQHQCVQLLTAHYMKNMMQKYLKDVNNLPNPQKIINGLKNSIEVGNFKDKKHVDVGRYYGIASNAGNDDHVIKQAESICKIKMEQMNFRLRLNIYTILQQLLFQNQQLKVLKTLTDQNQIFDEMKRLLRSKYENCKDKTITRNSVQDVISYSAKKLQNFGLSDIPNCNKDTIEQKWRKKYQKLQSQLTNTIQRISYKDKEISSIYNDLYKVRMSIQQNQIVINNLQKKNWQQKVQIEELQAERKNTDQKHQQQAQQWKSQKQQLIKINTEQQQSIKHLNDEITFVSNENKQLRQELVRWRDRFEWTEKQLKMKQQKVIHDTENITNLSKLVREKQNLQDELQQMKRKLQNYNNKQQGHLAQKSISSMDINPHKELNNEEIVKKISLIANQWKQKLQQTVNFYQQQLADKQSIIKQLQDEKVAMKNQKIKLQTSKNTIHEDNKHKRTTYVRYGNGRQNGDIS